jgi:prepilin-type N-terminal cleavage/methylation domain-containing protein
MKSKTSDAGFTLIELMATITCIAVIAAIAVPKVQGYLLQGRLESAKS